MSNERLLLTGAAFWLYNVNGCQRPRQESVNVRRAEGFRVAARVKFEIPGVARYPTVDGRSLEVSGDELDGELALRFEFRDPETMLPRDAVACDVSVRRTPCRSGREAVMARTRHHPTKGTAGTSDSSLVGWDGATMEGASSGR